MTVPLKRLLKLYLDTSVPNFLFAEDAKDKQKITQILFEPKMRNQYDFYVSVVVLREIERAPLSKQRELKAVLTNIPTLELTKEAALLAEAYIRA